MPLYLVEESVIKATVGGMLNVRPLWDLFEDGPIQRIEGSPFLHLYGPAVSFHVGAYIIILPAEIVEEIEDDC